MRTVAEYDAVVGAYLTESLIGHDHAADKQHGALHGITLAAEFDAFGELVADGDGHFDIAAFAGELVGAYLLAVKIVFHRNAHGRLFFAHTVVVNIRRVHVPIQLIALYNGLDESLDIGDIFKVSLILNPHLRHIGMKPVGHIDLLDLAGGRDVYKHRFILGDGSVRELIFDMLGLFGRLGRWVVLFFGAAGARARKQRRRQSKTQRSFWHIIFHGQSSS